MSKWLTPTDFESDEAYYDYRDEKAGEPLEDQFEPPILDAFTCNDCGYDSMIEDEHLLVCIRCGR